MFCVLANWIILSSTSSCACGLVIWQYCNSGSCKLLSPTFRDSFHLSFTIHKSKMDGECVHICVLGFWDVRRLNRFTNNVGLRYLLRDLIYLLRGIFWINYFWYLYSWVHDEDYRRLFTLLRLHRNCTYADVLILVLKYYNHLYWKSDRTSAIVKFS